MTLLKQPYYFSGSAIGAAARFHRLDEVHNLDHVVPTLGSSVLAVTGGVSRSEVSNYCFTVDHPRRRSLLSVRKIEVASSGRETAEQIETEVEGSVDSISVVEQLHIDRVKMHFRAIRDMDGNTKIDSKGTTIEGVRLGNVEAKVVLDIEPLYYCSDKEQLHAFYKSQSADYQRENSSRFEVPSTHPPSAAARSYRCTLVREIKLSGPEEELQKISLDRNTIVWDGFGRVILAEIFVSDYARRLTMVRLAMGSSAGGSGTIVCGQSNGQVGSG